MNRNDSSYEDLTIQANNYGELRNKSPELIWARLVSDIFNPLILPPVLFGVSFWSMGLPYTSILNILIIAVVFFTLVPLGIIYTFRSMKFIQNFDISERKERIKPFIVIIGSYVAGLVIFILLHPQPNYLPVYFTSCYIINAIAGSAITTRWKISIHSAGIASFSAIIIYLFEANLMAHNFIFDRVLVWSSLIIIPIIMWGRIKLHLHTTSQTIAGAVIGFIITYLELKIMIG